MHTKDLDYIIGQIRPILKELDGSTIMITGGTGWFGKWITQTLSCARWQYGYRRQYGYSIHWRSFGRETPNHISQYQPDYIIHMAPDDGICLSVMKRHKPKAVLYTSSGAAYMDGHNDELGAQKLASEKALTEVMPIKIARCYTFVGPDIQFGRFAVDAFIRDALVAGVINVKDGSPYRSYLYMADLVIWLLTILIKGENKIYNVGSEKLIQIHELAKIIGNKIKTSWTLLKYSGNPRTYYPNTIECKKLGLTETIGLSEALDRTIEWARGVL